MLRNTFCHIHGVGVKGEQSLWKEGIMTWDDLLKCEGNLFGRKTERIREAIKESQDRLQNGNLAYFAERLPDSQYWRFFSEFRGSTAYLNVETSSLDPWLQYITVMTLYDGKDLSSYVYGKNLNDFMEDVKKYSVLITYNGKRLDLPFLRIFMGLEPSQPHIDLRYLLNSVGLKGGLKGCEETIGIDRGDLKDLDGCSALALWAEYEKNHNKKALETLLSYSAYDAVSLESLMVHGYNLKLKDTPFEESHRLTSPEFPKIPFKADLDTILDLDYYSLYERGYRSRSITQWIYSY